MGSDSGLFSRKSKLQGLTQEEEEEREADAIWEAIDARMLERRRDRREERLKKELEVYRKKNPKITEQFVDLKRALKDMSEAEWEAIPEIGDRSVKRTPRGKTSYVPVPETLLARAAMEKQTTNTIDERDAMRDVSGIGGDGTSTTTDLTAVGEGRGTVLSMKLDRLSDSVAGQTVVDPKGYLTDLSSVKVNSQADIQDIKKARKLLQSVTQTNPKHAPGWIAAARLESDLGKGSLARQLIARGTRECPKSEDVWLHAVLLQQTQEEKKVCVAKGIGQCPQSVKLWMEASRLEETQQAKRRVLRRALERMPNSVRLWRHLVDLSEEEDARVLLRRAVECCPQHKELWLALAKLETYENARKVLNKARQTLPTEPLIWITAAKLEEANKQQQVVSEWNQKQTNMEMDGGEEDGEEEEEKRKVLLVEMDVPLVHKLVARAVKSLRQQGAVVTREQWLQHAEDCEKNSSKESLPSLATCGALVKACATLGVEDEDVEATLLGDAEECTQRGSIHTARCIYSLLTDLFPSQWRLWMRAAVLEQQKGIPLLSDAILRKGVTYCPTATTLWLMAAKDAWIKRDDVQKARTILQEAFAANPNSEQVVLAAFKLEFENNEIERAKLLLRRALTYNSNGENGGEMEGQGQQEGAGGASPRVWMKAALVERELGNPEEERRLLQEALKKHPQAWKLWLMLAQLHQSNKLVEGGEMNGNGADSGDVAGARLAFDRGMRHCPEVPELRLCAAGLEERLGNVSRARAMLEQARLKIPGVPEVWLAAIRLERRSGNIKACENLVAKALQSCPNSGILWSEVITTAPRPQRKSKSVDALKRCNNDPQVVCAVAQLFMTDHKVEKARAWFNRAVTLDPDCGDLWAHLYRYECAYGQQQQRDDVIARCERNDPKHGERWSRVSKSLENPHASCSVILQKTALDIDQHPIPQAP